MMALAVLLLFTLLLPLHLLSLASTLLIAKPNNNINNKRRPWILPLVSVPLLLSATILALSDLDSPSHKDDGLISGVENLKLKIQRLESILEENTDTLNSKTLHLDENNKLIEKMEHKIRFLQNSLCKIKTSIDSSADSETMVTALEEEVRLLWAESRKNNFNYHILESKAYEEEYKVEEVTSEVVKMENIVTEQWIQIRQLEQSLQMMKVQMMKIMTSNVRKKSTSKVHKKKPTKFTVLKFIKVVRHHHLQDGAETADAFFLGNYISKSCISRAFDQLRRMWSAVKKWHHELQDSVKWALEMNKFTAPLANKEVVFFVASVVVVMPLMSAWALFS